MVEAKALPPVLDAATGAASAPEGHTPPANHDDDVTDAEIISPESTGTADGANSAEDAAQATVNATGANATGVDPAHKPQNQA